MTRDPAATLHENIGNGIVRVNLAAVKEKDLEQLGRDFISSAAMHKGTMDRFLNKLEVLRKLTAEGVFPFNLDSLNEYLSEYEAAGYPAVSHSEKYRGAYAPTYRIVLNKEYEKREPVLIDWFSFLLSEDYLRNDDFFRCVADIIHSTHPSHLILCFEVLGDTFLFG